MEELKDLVSTRNDAAYALIDALDSLNEGAEVWYNQGHDEWAMARIRGELLHSQLSITTGYGFYPVGVISPFFCKSY